MLYLNRDDITLSVILKDVRIHLNVVLSLFNCSHFNEAFELAYLLRWILAYARMTRKDVIDNEYKRRRLLLEK